MVVIIFKERELGKIDGIDVGRESGAIGKARAFSERGGRGVGSIAGGIGIVKWSP